MILMWHQGGVFSRACKDTILILLDQSLWKAPICACSFADWHASLLDLRDRVFSPTFVVHAELLKQQLRKFTAILTRE